MYFVVLRTQNICKRFIQNTRGTRYRSVQYVQKRICHKNIYTFITYFMLNNTFIQPLV